MVWQANVPINMHSAVTGLPLKPNACLVCNMPVVHESVWHLYMTEGENRDSQHIESFPEQKGLNNDQTTTTYTCRPEQRQMRSIRHPP